jgi:hypothetical protein
MIIVEMIKVSRIETIFAVASHKGKLFSEEFIEKLRKVHDNQQIQF